MLCSVNKNWNGQFEDNVNDDDDDVILYKKN